MKIMVRTVTLHASESIVRLLTDEAIEEMRQMVEEQVRVKLDEALGRCQAVLGPLGQHITLEIS